MITAIRDWRTCVCLPWILSIFISIGFVSFHFRFMIFSLHFSTEAIDVRAMLEFRRPQQRLQRLQRQGTSRQVYFNTFFSVALLLLLPFSWCRCPQGEMNVTCVCIHTIYSPDIKKSKFRFKFFIFSIFIHVRRTEQSMFHLLVRIH